MLWLAPAVMLDQFAPAPRGSDWLALDSLAFGTSAGVAATWAVRPLVVYNDDGAPRANVVATQVVVHAGGTITAWDRVRLAVDLPAAVYQRGTGVDLAGTQLPAPAAAALGDARAAIDVRLLPALAVGAALQIPTGGDYAGAGSARADVHVSAAGDVGPVALAARASAGSDFTVAGAVGVRALGRRLLAGIEAVVVLDSPAPNELLLGVHYAPRPDVVVGIGAGPGIGRAVGTPAARMMISVEWRR